MKIDDLVDRTDRFVLQLGKDTLAHIKANVLKSRIVKLSGIKGTYWVNATSEDIKAEVDVSMESVSAPKTDPMIDRTQSIQFVQFLTQLAPVAAQLGQPLALDFNELVAWIIEKFGYKDVGRFFNSALAIKPPLVETLAEGQNSNNLNSIPTPAGATPEQPMNAADLQNQIGIAATQNASGLQLT
jgi:hypothetical protein